MVDINDRTLEITISRGDDAPYVIYFDDEIPPDGTEAIITVKRHLNSGNKVIEKTVSVRDGAINFAFTSDETNLIPDTYVWDVRLKYANGEIYTPIPPSPFTILGVVGNVS